jgi:ferredoxin
MLGIPVPAGLTAHIPGQILPWGYRPPAGDLADPLRGLEAEGIGLVRDFQGRAMALLAGAAVSGAAPLAPDYVYSHTLDGRPILFTDEPDFRVDETAVRLPRRAGRVLVMGFVRGPEIMGMNPGLSRLRPAGGWLDWPGQAAAALKMADFLKSLGFLALPSAVGLLMADHLGALAGLGELGRQGLLITPEYGPNLRLLTVITDYPFEFGRPAGFGVTDYCETCQRCITECPAKAVPEGRRRPGLYQWPVNRRACFDNWLEKRDPCRKCIEICPYTREPLVGSPGGVRREG